MDKLLRIILYSIPALAFAGLLLLFFRPELMNVGPRAVLEDRLRASQTDFPCPEYAYIRDNILSGGPPKDGIPSINHPVYIKADQAELADSDIIFGIDFQGFVAAYPASILVWHEVVNDITAGLEISVTYCPLTRSTIGFIGRSLGVSGTLYNSNLVMYDRVTESHIPQILGLGIDGELCGQLLPTFPVVTTTWENWRARHPETIVLTDDTGYRRDYGRDPYAGYSENEDIYFPLTTESVALPPKSMVLGIEHGGDSAAVVLDNFAQRHPEGNTFILGGGMITVWWDGDLQVVKTDSDVKQVNAFWFAWFAQHPETRVIE